MKEQFLKRYRRRIYRPGAEELLQWLETTDFYHAPAFRLAHEGGLVEHSVYVHERLRRLYMLEFMKGEIPYLEQDESIAICRLLHGVGMVKDDLPFGYGEKSVYLISNFMKLTSEEAIAIRWHRGFTDAECKRGGCLAGNAFEKYPLALLTHITDLQAAYLDEAGRR